MAGVGLNQCQDLMMFKRALKQLRALDDKIIYALNMSTPTASMQARGADPRERCVELREKLDQNYKVRGERIVRCVSELEERVRDHKGDPGQISMEQTRLRSFKSEMDIEEIVQQRTEEIFRRKSGGKLFLTVQKLFPTVQWLVDEWIEAEARLRMALQEWRDTVGGAATVCTILQFLVGAQVCLGFYKVKSTGESSILTFLVGVVMTFVWMNYGVMVEDSTIQTVNAIGLMLQSIYVCCFYSITSRKLQTGKKIFLTVLFLLMVGTYIMTQEDKTAAQLNIGWLGASMSVAYCSAPLASIQEVCRSRSTKSLPFYLILVTCVVTGLWTLYGHIIKDSFVSVPNCLGFLASTFQLGLFSYFPSPATEYKPLSTEI